MLISQVWFRDHGTPGQSGISSLLVPLRLSCWLPFIHGCPLVIRVIAIKTLLGTQNLSDASGSFSHSSSIDRRSADAHEADTAITRRPERRIKDGPTSTSNPHHPPPLSSSFTFYPGHEQLTTAAHRPHDRCCSWERGGCVLYTPPLDSRPSFIGPYCS
jgi:hypothetical protein